MGIKISQVLSLFFVFKWYSKNLHKRYRVFNNNKTKQKSKYTYSMKLNVSFYIHIIMDFGKGIMTLTFSFCVLDTMITVLTDTQLSWILTTGIKLAWGGREDSKSLHQIWSGDEYLAVHNGCLTNYSTFAKIWVILSDFPFSLTNMMSCERNSLITAGLLVPSNQTAKTVEACWLSVGWDL